MTPTPARLRLPALRDRFLALLSEAQCSRNEHPDWVLRERRLMRDLVNIERLCEHLPALPITAVERVETMAEGHSDYSSKFALYCAELALGIKP